MILAIDPGCTESAYVLMRKDLKPIEFLKVANTELLKIINDEGCKQHNFAIEMVAHYGTGMPAGKEIFDTCFWIGRFWHEAERMRYKNMQFIYRKHEKINLCGNMKAKDGNIIQALKDRFGDKGTKANPGWFYGFKADCWQAYAVGVTYHDLYCTTIKSSASLADQPFVD